MIPYKSCCRNIARELLLWDANFVMESIRIIPLQRTSNPNFLSTVSFRKSDGLDSQTQVRLAVYDVRERVTNTTTQLGQATASFSTAVLIHRAGVFFCVCVRGGHSVRLSM